VKSNKFKLSPAGKLAAAVAIISVSVATCYATGIVGAGGNDHQPGINKANNGATVVDIVKPSASGLSHNQYKKFNVDKPGAVFNNSLTSGQSQLAGQLGANNNLNGQAAKIILNEVISRNPSMLLGQQEVFGMAADYLLANPNSITCNGCGFINTNNASLVVGKVNVDGYGNITSFNNLNLTYQNALKIGEQGLTTAGYLNLIAPKIASDGKILAKEINAIIGTNNISAKGDIRSTAKIPWNLDSHFLGGMQAGRIRIINTSARSDITLNNTIKADNGIDISAGRDTILKSDTRMQGGDIKINANGITAKSDINTQQNGKKSTQTLNRVELKGKNISLVANKKNHLSATKIDGENVNLTGGELVLDGRTLTNTAKESPSDSGNGFLGAGKWSWSKNKEEKQQTHIGTAITAKNNAALESTQADIKLSAATITAGKNLAIKAKQDLQLEGAIDENSIHDHGHDYAHTRHDKTWDNKTATQKLNKTELHAGKNLGLTAKNKITTQGIKASAGGDVVIDATEAKIDVQKTRNWETKDGKHEKIMGWIGGEDHNNNSKNAETSHRSEITANGNIIIGAKENVAITGSKVKAAKDGFVQAKDGGIRIDNAISTTTTRIDERTGVAFNITESSKKANNSEQKSTGSEVVSEANLKIISKDDVNVIGSLVKSAGELGIETLGDINVKAAQEQQKIDEQKTQLTVDGFTSDNGKNQFKAGLKLEHTSESEKSEHVKNQASTLEGGSVDLKADKDVVFTGSQLNTTQGDANISAENVSFVAAQDTTSSNKEKETVGFNAHYTGGMDKAGNGIGVGYEDTTSKQEKTTAVTSGSHIAGNMNINANKDVTNQGTQHNIEGTYKVDAENVNNLAAENSDKTDTHTKKIEVGVGANVDYSGITRPIEKTITEAKNLNVMGSLESTKELGNTTEKSLKSTKDLGLVDRIKGLAETDLANAGVDVNVNVNDKNTTVNIIESAVTQIKSGETIIKAKNDITDQGTDYEANKGAIKLEAEKHNSIAVFDRIEKKEDETFANVDVRVYTETGQDININGKGEGGSKHQESTSETAQTGNMRAANGIEIKVKDDAYYQGTNMDAGAGKTLITAGNNIHFDQATNTHHENHENINANVKANGGTSPNGKNIGGGLGGGHSKGESNNSVAQTGHIQGQQGVELHAGKNLTLKGTEIGSKENPTGDITLTAGENITLLAAESHSSKQDMTWSASARGGASKNQNTEKTSSGMKAGFDVKVAKTDESANTFQGSNIHSNGKVTVTAGSNDNQAIHLQNTNITSKETVLNAKDGGISIESAVDKEHKNNWNVGIDANGSKKNSMKLDDKGVADKDSAEKTHKVGANLNVGVNHLNSVTQQNSHINSNTVTLNSGKDTTLAGAVIKADNVNGDIGGDLNIESRKDTRHHVQVNLGLGAGHTNEKQDSLIDQIAGYSPAGSGKIEKILANKSDQLFDKTKEKFNTLGSASDDSIKTISYSQNGKTIKASESDSDNKEATKDKLWQKGAKFIGKKVKDKTLNKQEGGTDGKVKTDVEVVDNDAVEEQSAINGTQTVNLNVQGKTVLTGGQIASEQGEVQLNTSEIQASDIHGKNTEGGARLNVSSSVGQMAQDAFKDLKNGKAPLVSGHGSSEQKNAIGGIISGQTR
jgi:hemolysin